MDFNVYFSGTLGRLTQNARGLDRHAPRRDAGLSMALRLALHNLLLLIFKYAFSICQANLCRLFI